MDNVKLTSDELDLLTAACRCEGGKGVMVPKELKRAASGLVRKGLAWTVASIFTVCIATDDGRAAISKATGGGQ